MPIPPPTDPVPEVSADSKPLVVITGRASNGGRKSHLLRLRPDVVADIRKLVDGPLSLVTEVALRHYAQYLRSEKPDGGVIIKASELG